jgi:hypothetical protein
LLGETASGLPPQYITELVQDLTKAELEAMILKIRRSKTPLHPPYLGLHYKLVGINAHPYSLPSGLSAKELGAIGKIRIMGDRWYRLFNLVVHWRIVAGVSDPKGQAALNKLKTHCVRGHPLSGDNLKSTKSGHRRCKQCARDAAKRSRAKSRLKRRRLIGPNPAVKRVTLSDRELDKKEWSR